MKLSAQWSIIPTAIATVFALSGLAASQPVSISPGSQSISLSGTSGGTRKDAGCAGYIAKMPNHTIQVTADTNLRLSLQGAGAPTLLITGLQGQNICLQADKLSKGKIEIPGRWTKGTYSVFVGDRAQGQNPYTLSIAPQKR
ncbi:hypothetical protein [Myxacorys almedinensis]|uniref:Uncharacterized protein n=1 Tax=Myxacorys almedinensis A TaxID=2690445 RepID=A0A8J7Z1X8_9CYAN|nr:hypothetical protein [Myxacorys almedinensis]NDJ16301.1 hypothetical protein [Myxacorys almedinensis A]